MLEKQRGAWQLPGIAVDIDCDMNYSAGNRSALVLQDEDQVFQPAVVQGRQSFYNVWPASALVSVLCEYGIWLHHINAESIITAV